MPMHEITERTAAIVDGYLHVEGPLLPILHDVQATFGHVPDAAVEKIADLLNLSRAEVHGVKSFYHDFQTSPAGHHVLKVCRAEACQAVGGDALGDAIQKALGLDWHETSADGTVTLEPVYCLGLCSCAPAVMLDGELRGRLKPRDAEALAAEVRR
ncbi:MAG: formate dehydrogenase subunit gamma [Rhodobacteraceae bacterium]|nr:formate dehydrogenase subunit gamma [Paracoccaceae bacterium]